MYGLSLKSVKRNIILSLTRMYASSSIKRLEFRPGVDAVPVSGKVLDSEDYVNLIDACLDGWLTNGRFTEKFEKDLAKYVGTRYALFCNSGSSANLLALSALTSPKLGNQSLKPGDEVITVASGFPTTINPIIQNGLKPVLVDIDRKTLNANVTQISEAITPKTKAIILAHTLGNPFDISSILEICKENNLYLIEDSCDALGSTYKSNMVGTFGTLATLSFYPAHHITTGEGGAVLVNSPLIKRQVESFRDWGRDCYCPSGKDNTCFKRFEWQLGGLPLGYDHKYIYSHVGYNLKATDIQAALGSSQLAKVDEFIEKRRENFSFLRNQLGLIKELEFCEPTPGSNPSWFGFPITLKEGCNINRDTVLKFLESRNIGTRLLFAGNITKQPAYKSVAFRKIGDLGNSNYVMERTFWIGVHPGLSPEMMKYISDSLLSFFLSSSKG